MSEQEAWDRMCDLFARWLVRDSEAHGGPPGELPYMSNRALCWVQLELRAALLAVEVMES